MHAREVGLFKQAITGSDNTTIDPSMVALLFSIVVLLPSIVAVLAGLSFIDVYLNKQAFNPVTLSTGIAASVGGVCLQVLALVRMLRTDRQVSDGLTPPPAAAP